MDSDLRKLQLEELRVMKLIDSICTKENLTYFMIGGTLLGAIRHKGFIPWDDDIDIAMPRADYVKFMKIANDYFPDNMVIQNFRTDKNYRYYITRILNTNIMVDEKRFLGTDTPQGYAAVDIFPIDGSPNNKYKRILYYKKVLLLRYLISLCYRDSIDFERKRSKKEQFVLNLLLKIPFEKYFNPNNLKEKLDLLLSKYSMVKSDWSGTIMGAYRLREIVPTIMFGKPILYKFEDKEFFGPELVDKYLKHMYGEYMQLPPIEQQKTHYTNVKIINPD